MKNLKTPLLIKRGAVYWYIKKILAYDGYESGLTEESVEVLREVLKDPYFIGAS